MRKIGADIKHSPAQRTSVPLERPQTVVFVRTAALQIGKSSVKPWSKRTTGRFGQPEQAKLIAISGFFEFSKFRRNDLSRNSQG